MVSENCVIELGAWKRGYIESEIQCYIESLTYDIIFDIDQLKSIESKSFNIYIFEKILVHDGQLERSFSKMHLTKLMRRGLNLFFGTGMDVSKRDSLN